MRREISIDDPPPGGHEFSWVRRLAAAILHRAVMDAARYRLLSSRSGRQTRAGNEAWDFVMASDRVGPFCFTSLCLIVDMNPKAIRDKVEREPLTIIKPPRTRSLWNHPDVRWEDEEEPCETSPH